MKDWTVPVTAVATIIGVLLAVQYRTQADATRLSAPSQRVQDLALLLKSTEKANRQLSDQVAELQGQLAKTRPVQQVADPAHQGYPAVSGPGLQVAVTESAAGKQLEDGTSAVVHAEDLLKIVNDLHAGGAEAVAVNGHRLVETSEIVTAGQHVMVNKQPVHAPYTIMAIGPAEDMKTALALRGGVVEYLQFYGIEVKTKAVPHIELPALNDPAGFRYAKPAPTDAAGADAGQAAG